MITLRLFEREEVKQKTLELSLTVTGRPIRGARRGAELELTPMMSALMDSVASHDHCMALPRGFVIPTIHECACFVFHPVPGFP
jgi:hypothetical protein